MAAITAVQCALGTHIPAFAEAEAASAGEYEAESVPTENETEATEAESVPIEDETEAGFGAIAINSGFAIINGEERQIPPVKLIFGRAYSDIYPLAEILDLKLEWKEAENGYFHAESETGAGCDFTLISDYRELKNAPYKFFVEDGSIYISVREAADFAGKELLFDNGAIIFGNGGNPFDGKEPDLNSNDGYIYETYPVKPEYVVNPYVEYSYENMLTDADRLCEMYPDLISLSSVGRSVEDRNLLLISLGRGDKKIFVCGTHHAREYIATTYIMYAIDRYAYAYRTGSDWNGYDIYDILNKVTFCIVPMVNPDGVNLVQNGVYATKNPQAVLNMRINESANMGYAAWKANVNGVGVNWNYDKDWYASKNSAPRGSTGFNGESAGTEPETVAISNYVDSNCFEAYISVHTQGQIFYWAEDKNNPTGLDALIQKDTGFSIVREKAEGRGGSFFDYVYRKYNKPTITIELCPYIGNYPFPNERFDTAWNPAKNIFLIVGKRISEM